VARRHRHHRSLTAVLRSGSTRPVRVTKAIDSFMNDCSDPPTSQRRLGSVHWQGPNGQMLRIVTQGWNGEPLHRTPCRKGPRIRGQVATHITHPVSQVSFRRTSGSCRCRATAQVGPTSGPTPAIVWCAWLSLCDQVRLLLPRPCVSMGKTDGSGSGRLFSRRLGGRV
jgi:hypothetical protein